MLLTSGAKTPCFQAHMENLPSYTLETSLQQLCDISPEALEESENTSASLVRDTKMLARLIQEIDPKINTSDLLKHPPLESTHTKRLLSWGFMSPKDILSLMLTYHHIERGEYTANTQKQNLFALRQWHNRIEEEYGYLKRRNPSRVNKKTNAIIESQTDLDTALIDFLETVTIEYCRALFAEIHKKEASRHLIDYHFYKTSTRDNQMGHADFIIEQRVWSSESGKEKMIYFPVDIKLNENRGYADIESAFVDQSKYRPISTKRPPSTAKLAHMSGGFNLQDFIISKEYRYIHFPELYVFRLNAPFISALASCYLQEHVYQKKPLDFAALQEKAAQLLNEKRTCKKALQKSLLHGVQYSKTGEQIVCDAHANMLDMLKCHIYATK